MFLLPVRDENPRQLAPIVNWAIIILNFVFFGLELLYGDRFVASVELHSSALHRVPPGQWRHSGTCNCAYGNVHARRLGPHSWQHAVPVAIRRQRRRCLWPCWLSCVLPGVWPWRKRGAIPDRHDFAGDQSWRVGRDQRCDGRIYSDVPAREGARSFSSHSRSFWATLAFQPGLCSACGSWPSLPRRSSRWARSPAAALRTGRMSAALWLA